MAVSTIEYGPFSSRGVEQTFAIHTVALGALRLYQDIARLLRQKESIMKEGEKLRSEYLICVESFGLKNDDTVIRISEIMEEAKNLQYSTTIKGKDRTTKIRELRKEKIRLTSTYNKQQKKGLEEAAVVFTNLSNKITEGSDIEDMIIDRSYDFLKEVFLDNLIEYDPDFWLHVHFPVVQQFCSLLAAKDKDLKAGEIPRIGQKTLVE